MTVQESLELSPELVGWIEAELGGRLVCAERQPGGGRREAWFIDVADATGGDEVRELFLRYDRADPEETGDPFTLQDEAKVFLALQDTAVPTPTVYAVHPTEQAIVMSRVVGRAWFSQLKDEVQREAIAREFMTVLAELHRVDPHVLELTGQDPDADLRDLVRIELDRWERLYREAAAPADPLIEAGLRYLRVHVPDASGPVAIIQGDTGPGNFMFDDGRVTAVLDWELAHFGDPHDDLAWVTQRSLQEPFTSMPDRIADYERAAGVAVDRERVWYYRVFASVRILILGHNSSVKRALLSDVGTLHAYGMLHRRVCVEGLAHVHGVELPETADLEAPPTDHGWLYDVALAQIAQIIVPRSTDPFVIQRSKGLARLLKHLAQIDRLGAVAQQQYLDDVAAVLGVRPGSVADADAQLVKAGDTVPVDELVRLLHRQVLRRQQLLRPAMGALVDRHYDPLD